MSNSPAQDAARDQGRELMLGDRDQSKVGSSHEAAAAAAIDAHGLAAGDASELRCYLLGFALGLHRTADAGTATDGRGDRFQLALRAGRDDGRANAGSAHPAEVPLLKRPTRAHARTAREAGGQP